MKIIAKTFFGLEDLLVEEIKELGGKNIKKLKRSVEFEGDKKILYKANYTLRTALKILIPLFDFKFTESEDFYQKIYEFDWSKYFQPSYTFVVDPVVKSEIFTNTLFAAYRTKDAIVDFFRKKTGIRPSVDKNNPDIKVNLYINGNYCNISLDASGKPLFMRGWRKAHVAAPLNEVLAAGIIKLSQWDMQKTFIDFMCGSGTLPIEAAMQAFNIPAQIKRDTFSFMKWKDFDYTLWQQVTEEEKAKIDYDKKISIFANDKSPEAVKITNLNIRSLGLKKYIQVSDKSFEKIRNFDPVHIVFNPPYGKRIGTDKNINEFYKSIGDALKKNFSESEAWMFTGNRDALKFIGLRPSKKIMLYNGAIESRLVKYEIY